MPDSIEIIITHNGEVSKKTLYAVWDINQTENLIKRACNWIKKAFSSDEEEQCK
jgi:hypothetical protein